MSRFLRVLAVGCAIASSSAEALSAQAGSYLLNSSNPDNGIDVTLLAGTWSIGVSNGGWSPWNYVSNCDANGRNCQTGFHTDFFYTVNGGPVQKYGWDGSERTIIGPPYFSDFYATPELAFANVFAPFTLEIFAPTQLRLFITDCCYWDNTGSVTVTVAEVAKTTVTPEPASIALMSTGLAGIGLIVRRRRRA